jgi:type IV secretion system protein VirB9
VIKALVIACGLLASTAATAQSVPLPPPPGAFGGSTRLQTPDYIPDQVYPLRVAPGFQLTLELAQDEQVENVAVGDSGGWQVAVNHRGNRLFIKPLQSGTTTNMVVITDTRVYSFELTPADPGASDLPYIVRFRYPSQASASLRTLPAAAPAVGRYKFSGDKRLRPTGMHDDGVHTYIDWPADMPLSAIYVINERGQETLVDSSIRNDQIVIDSVHKCIVFRRDGARATATRRRDEKP